MSTGSEDRDCIALDLKLFCLSFLPIILITVLQRENNAVQEAGRNYILMIALNQVYIVKKKQKTGTYITEVKSIYSGLDEEGIVWGQMRLGLCLLILCLVVQLQ